MKKSSLALLSMVLSGSVCAATFDPSAVPNAEPEVQHLTKHVQLSLFAPVQCPDETADIKGLRLSGIYGESYSLTGLDLGVSGYVTENTTGCQLALGGSWDDLDMTGVQFGTIVNVVGGYMKGVQLSAILNYDRGDFAGVQGALINLDGSFKGLQLGGVNYSRRTGNVGCQIGLVNVNDSAIRGLSIGGVNLTEQFVGCQIGVFNVVTMKSRGCQIGLFNGSPDHTGIQIGLLNAIGNSDLPAMPLFNALF